MAPSKEPIPPSRLGRRRMGEGAVCRRARRHCTPELQHQGGSHLGHRRSATSPRAQMNPHLKCARATDGVQCFLTTLFLGRVQDQDWRFKMASTVGVTIHLADGVGFEPTDRLHDRRISSPVHSTALPPIRRPACLHVGGFRVGSLDLMRRQGGPILASAGEPPRHKGNPKPSTRSGESKPFSVSATLSARWRLFRAERAL
jgi:hypothetical protein